MPDADDFAHNTWANDRRRDKAVVIARWLWARGVTAEQAESMGEDERKDAERRAGKERTDVPELERKAIRTSHRDELWTIVAAALRAKARHTPPPPAEPLEPAVGPALVPTPAVGIYPCGCTQKPGCRITDQARHDEWHRIVAEQSARR